MRSAFSFYQALPFYVNGNPISSFITPWVRSMWVCQYVVNWVWLSACRALQVNWIFFKDQFVEILNDPEQQDILVLFSRMEYLVLDIDGKHFKKLEDLSRDSLLWESLCGTRVRDAVSVSQSRSEALTSHLPLHLHVEKEKVCQMEGNYWGQRWPKFTSCCELWKPSRCDHVRLGLFKISTPNCAFYCIYMLNETNIHLWLISHQNEYDYQQNERE